MQVRLRVQAKLHSAQNSNRLHVEIIRCYLATVAKWNFFFTAGSKPATMF